MAENIVAGLFGLTPEMYGEQQRTGALAEGIRLAQLDPAARGAAMTYAGARGLGNAIGGAFGIEDPQLKMISARNSVFQQIDQSDPESMLQGIRMLGQMGDQQGAMALAEYYRKAQGEMAQTEQRLAAGKASLAQAARERVQATPDKIQIAERLSQLNLALDKLNAMEATPERDEAIRNVSRTIKAIELQVEKPQKAQTFGTDREAVAAELYNKPFADLSQTEKAAVNKRVDAEKPKTTITNVMPGDKTLADIPAFRASVQRTIDPQLKAVTAADNALENIQDSIDTNNFASFRAAQTQFARAISGSGDLSQKELLAAGADPSLLGGTADYVARLFTSTPTLDTQEKIKKTLLAIKKVSTNKAKTEIEAQRKIAYSNPGYEKARVDQALDFPEFSGQNIATPSAADYAAQAKAILEQRKKVTK